MPDSNVPITAGSGTNIDTRTASNGDHRQVVAVGNDGDNVASVDSSGRVHVKNFLTTPGLDALGVFAGITGYGNQRVTPEPASLFHDPFDSAVGLDTTHRWSTTGTAPTLSSGAVVLTPGTVANTASTQSALHSKTTFPNIGLGFLAVGFVARFETINSTNGTAFHLNAHRFMGVGTVAGTWTPTYSNSSTSGPVLHGIGFEIDTDGLMYPVVYSNGTRTRPALLNGQANLNVGRALPNGELHQFLMVIRADTIIWYLDGTDTPVASYSYRTTGYGTLDLSTLPLRFHTINGSSAPSGTMLFRVGAVGVGDTGRNLNAIGDPVYPWRRASVTDPAAIGGALQHGSQDMSAGGALNVNPNAIQKATYRFTVLRNNPGNYVAGTTVYHAALHHAASATKTVRIRRITVAHQFPATAEGSRAELHYLTAAPTAGTTVSAGTGSATQHYRPMDGRTANGEATATLGPTVTSAGIVSSAFLSTGPATAHAGGCVLYDWQESGETMPLTLRAGVLEGIAVGVNVGVAITSAASTTQVSVEILFTEE